MRRADLLGTSIPKKLQSQYLRSSKRTGSPTNPNEQEDLQERRRRGKTRWKRERTIKIRTQKVREGQIRSTAQQEVRQLRSHLRNSKSLRTSLVRRHC